MILSPIASGPVTFTLTHNGSYIGRPGRRPEIEVDVATVTASNVLRGTVRTTVLVDSGADYTMLDAAQAGPLGIDLAQCPVGYVSGIEGRAVPVRLARVLMYLCGRWVDVGVCFKSSQRPQLLGRQDVFDSLLITFFHQSNDLYASTA